jgi:hypothetical protein
MARGQIEPEVFALVADPTLHRSSLGCLSELIDWSSVDQHPADIYALPSANPPGRSWPCSGPCCSASGTI